MQRQRMTRAMYKRDAEQRQRNAEDATSDEHIPRKRVARRETPIVSLTRSSELLIEEASAEHAKAKSVREDAEAVYKQLYNTAIDVRVPLSRPDRHGLMNDFGRAVRHVRRARIEFRRTATNLERVRSLETLLTRLNMLLRTEVQPTIVRQDEEEGWIAIGHK